MSHSSPTERLVHEVQGLIVNLKKEYFSTKEPLNDDEILVHKLCVRLENVLRYGAREKYSFMGVRKDYWNFISESVPKDETVRFVQAIPDFKTNQGKGRAFLREALMQKSLADTLQRTIINTRITKDYFGTDSVIRNEVHFQSLIHSLYDLNAVEFLLPHQGYDLDKSFPSFARKMFNSRSNSRRSSISSIQSFQPDPLQNLRTNVSLIELVINAWLGKVTEHVDNTSEVSLLQLIDKLALLREHIILLKSRSSNEVEVLKTDIEKLKEEKLKSEAYVEQRLSLVHDHYKSIHDNDSSTANEKIEEVCEKLINTERILTEIKAKRDNDITIIQALLAESQEECGIVKAENKDLSELLEKYKIDVANVKETNHSCSSTNKILENKLSELQKINTSLKSNEKEMTENNRQLEQLIKIKDTELNVLQDAFQKSTGLVSGSVEELKTQLCSQQSRTSEVLNTVCSTNEGLLNESKALLNTNNELSFKIQVLEEKLLQETNKKEEIEKIVSNLKSKYTEDMKHHCELQNFVGDVWGVLNGDNEELDDIEGDGLMTKSTKCNKDAALQKLVVLKNDVALCKKTKEVADEEITKVKRELSQITEALDKTQKKLDDASDSENKYKALEEETAKLKLDIETYNGKIYDMSVDIINLNESLVQKQGDVEREKNIISLLQNDVELIKNEKEDLLKNNETFQKQIDDLSVGKYTLLEQLKRESTKEATLFDELDSLKKEVKNANDVALQELQTLRFQLSTEEIKKETAVKELADAVKQKETAMNDLTAITEKFKELKGKQNMENDNWSSEKETLIAQCEEQNQQCDNAKNRYTIAEKEITFLKVELAKLAKEKDEEKTLHIDASNQINTMIEESRSKEEELTSTINQHTQDLKDIKSLLVNSTKEKHELWQKKEHLEHELTEMKERSAERWVTDTEVIKCRSCEELFTLTRRKHHCRLCGHIFCNDCSNRWIKNNQRRKRVRACNSCADSLEENPERGEKGSPDEAISDMNSTCDRMSFQSSDEEVYDTERRVTEVITGETINEETINENPSVETISENPSVETATGAFEILAAEEVSNAGSFGSNQVIKILSTDEMKSSLIPVCHTDDELPVQMEKIDINVTAGIRVLLPVIVPGSMLDLSWEFTSFPKDVGFGVAFKPNEEESNEYIQTIVPLSRYISHKLTIHGKMTIGNPGTYYLVFDNSYSRLTTKNVTCMVGLARCKKS